MTIGQFLLYVFTPALVVLLLALGYIAHIYGDLIRLARYEYWTDRFFSSAKALIENPETPDQIIELISSINRVINNKASTYALYAVYRDVLLGKTKRGADGSQSDSGARAFLQKHRDAIPHVENIMHAGLLAMTYASAIMGTQARAILADVSSLGNSAEWEGIKPIEERVLARSGSLVPVISRI